LRRKSSKKTKRIIIERGGEPCFKFKKSTAAGGELKEDITQYECQEKRQWGWRHGAPRIVHDPLKKRALGMTAASFAKNHQSERGRDGPVKINGIG